MQASILPLTTVERLENCLSPSSNLSASDRRELYARLLQNSSIIDDIGAVKHIFKAPLNLPESEEIVIKSNKFDEAPWCCAVKQCNKFDEAPWCCAVKQSINVKNVFIRTSEFEQTILGGHSNPDTNFLTYELVANLREERSLFNHFL